MHLVPWELAALKDYISSCNLVPWSKDLLSYLIIVLGKVPSPSIKAKIGHSNQPVLSASTA